jgi:hypothetical protein
MYKVYNFKYILHYNKWFISADNDSDKRQIRPLVKEGSRQRQNSNCEKVINIWSWAQAGARHQDWLSGRQSQCDFYFYFDFEINPFFIPHSAFLSDS